MFQRNKDYNPNEIARNQIRSLSRRDLIKLSGGCAALSSTSLLAQLLNLQLTKTAVAAEGDAEGYKALVCVFLFGGVDSFNVLAPYEDDEYAAYSAIRTNLALPQEDLHPITDSNGRQFGVHPGMQGIADIFNAGDAAFVANVGSLIQPTDRQSYDSQSSLPLGLFSHSDFIQHWQTSIPQSRSSVNGWVGRMADMLTDSVNDNPHISMNIALNSLNIMQTGSTVTPYIVATNGATTLGGYSQTTGNTSNKIYTQATDGLLGRTYSDLLEQTFADRKRSSIDGAAEFNAAVGEIELTTVFPASSLAEQLKMVAKAIAARDTLSQRRQIFFVSAGGWDHHDDLLSKQAGMLPMVSGAMSAFYEATKELGCENEVTTFTASDFARTLTTNGDGSDHAWGGNHIVMGGAVNGSHVYGTYPESLNPSDNVLDVGRGRLIPTTSVDEYNAELANWFGIPNDSSLESVLPNVRNFFGAGSTLPLGFLS